MSEIEARLAALEAELNEVAGTTRRLYLIFVWTGAVTVAATVLPPIFFALALPRPLPGIEVYAGGLTGL